MIKLFEEYHQHRLRADIICANYGIENYTINSDGSVDGEVNFSKKDEMKEMKGLKR